MFLLKPTIAIRLTSQLQRRYISAISLNSIEARWPKLPEGEQGAIAESIYAKERGDWNKMTLDEKRTSYFISYGAYGQF